MKERSYEFRANQIEDSQGGKHVVQSLNLLFFVRVEERQLRMSLGCDQMVQAKNSFSNRSPKDLVAESSLQIAKGAVDFGQFCDDIHEVWGGDSTNLQEPTQRTE